MAHARVRRPPFCPNPVCDFHRNSRGWRYKKAGFYLRRAAPHRIQRYRCSHCRRNFSSQTFSTTYWLKCPELLELVYHALVSCSCFRQAARIVGCSPSTIMGLSARLGRHAMLFHEMHRPKMPLCEPLVVDGFESFEFSQFHPLHVNVLAGESHFFYAFTDAPLRRKGRMTVAQRRKRDRDERHYGRPDPKAIEKSMAAGLALVANGAPHVVVRSDEHPAYPRAFRRLLGVRVQHERTSSKRARTVANPLFPVNRIDLLMRHSSSNHKRETIAFSKRRQSVVERVAIFQVWHNYQKSFSEKKRDATPAQRLGLFAHKLATNQILARRLFASRIRLQPLWQRYYDREVVTQRIPNGRRHLASYAY